MGGCSPMIASGALVPQGAVDPLRNAGTCTYVPTIRNRKPNASAPSRMAVFRPRDVEGAGLSRTALGRLVAAGSPRARRPGPLHARERQGHAAPHPGRGGEASPQRGRVSPLCTAIPWAHHAEPSRGLDRHRRKGEETRRRLAAAPPREVLGRGPHVRDRAARHRGRRGAPDVTREDGGGCFKYRNRIGLDVALEALRAYLRAKRRSVDDLVRAAEVCRVAKVMRPYLEGIA